jgi:predicted pyridoxine 5'-phosphate oxidase superfamily flavin-nucleotide-binding protein
MSYQLNPEVRALLADTATVKVVATTDEKGAPYVTASPFLQVAADGRLIHLELLETSATNRNLVRSLWFDRPLAVTLIAGDGRSYLLKGKPVKAVITGPLFSHYYRQVRAILGDVDLAAVWYMTVEEIVNETHVVRQAEEERHSPFYVHLDRLTIN